MHDAGTPSTTTTITISAEADKLLARHKQPGMSFSDVILDHFGTLRAPAQTAVSDLIQERRRGQRGPASAFLASRRAIRRILY